VRILVDCTWIDTCAGRIDAAAALLRNSRVFL
jgi:hypothetical protein